MTSARRSFLVALLVIVTAGCHSEPPPKRAIVTKPVVALLAPQKRTLERAVSQPGYVYAYEQTSIYPKVSGFISKWTVDIGDKIKKGQPLCDIYVPELDAELSQKTAQVALQEVNVKVAEQMLAVAKQNQEVAAAQTLEAQATIKKYDASVERWQSEVKRLTALSVERVLDQQVLGESQKQLKADTASRDASKASALAAEASERARAADVAKAKVDIEAAKAQVLVDRAAEQRLAALVGYTHITAPYDGVVVARNANTGDYVQPATGDLSAQQSSRDESANRGAPIYVVARTDLVRVYVDVPENDAPYVTVKTPASVVLPALFGDSIAAAVTRTSWALNQRSRTLRAEIDLPNTDSRLLPGMYAYGEVHLKRPDVYAIPVECVVAQGNQTICYLYDNGKAIETPVQTGINDGKWIEVARRRQQGAWVVFTGAEQVIKGDLGQLINGQDVDAVKTASPSEQAQQK
jgi:HlyD family secretion protein